MVDGAVKRIKVQRIKKKEELAMAAHRVISVERRGHMRRGKSHNLHRQGSNKEIN